MPTQQGVLKMNRYNITRSIRHAAGFSMVEGLMALAVISCATGATLPSIQESIEKRRLESIAAQLHTDLQMARSQAVALNKSVRVSYQSTNSESCYVIHTGAAADCRCTATGAAVCTNGAEALKTAGFSAQSSVQMRSNVASMLIDPAKGTVSPTGTVRVLAGSQSAIHAVVNIMGRTRLCTTSPQMSGYPKC